MTTVSELMTSNVECISMDMSIGQAMEVCTIKKIRHLPIIDDSGQLAGLVTDRDLRYSISPRIGTISENNSDRESLKRPVHLIMIHAAVVATPEMRVAEAAQRMLSHRIGCLPVVDQDNHVVGLITTSDLLRFLARWDGPH